MVISEVAGVITREHTVLHPGGLSEGGVAHPSEEPAVQPGLAGFGHVEQAGKGPAWPPPAAEYPDQVFLIGDVGFGRGEGDIALIVTHKAVFCQHIVTVGEEAGAAPAGAGGSSQGVDGVALVRRVRGQQGPAQSMI